MKSIMYSKNDKTMSLCCLMTESNTKQDNRWLFTFIFYPDTVFVIDSTTNKKSTINTLYVGQYILINPEGFLLVKFTVPEW